MIDSLDELTVALVGGRPYLLPAAGFSTPKQCVDHRHVRDCVVDRRRDFACAANCRGETVSLHGVLIRGVNLDDLFAASAAIVDGDSAALGCARRERKVQLDPAASAEELDALMRHHGAAAVEGRGTAIEA